MYKKQRMMTLKLRKIAVALAAVLLLAALSVTAAAETWSMEGITLQVPDGMYKFDSSTPVNDPAWALAGIGDPQTRLKDYGEMNALVNYVSEDGKTSIQIMKKESTYTSQLYNLDLLPQEQEQSFLDDLISSQSDSITVEKSYYPGKQVTFYRVEMNGETSDGQIHELLYGTIVNGFAFNIDLYNGANEITPEQEALVRDIVDSVEFDEILEKPETTVSQGDIAMSIFLLAVLVAIVVVPLIYLPIKGKRDKKRKAKLAEELTEYHKTHGNNDVIPGEMRFANSTECTREAIHSFSIYQAYVKSIGALLIGVLLSVVILVMSFMLDAEWWIKILAVGIAGYYVYKVFTTPHTIEKIQTRVYDRGTSKTAHYAFYDEAFRVSGIQSASVFPYFQIMDVRKNGQYIYLYYGPDNAYMVDQYGFSLGEYEDFCKFISERTGKKL